MAETVLSGPLVSKTELATALCKVSSPRFLIDNKKNRLSKVPAGMQERLTKPHPWASRIGS